MFRVLSCLGGEHDLSLVALAAVICFLASVTAISLFHRAQAATERGRIFWILIAGTVTGCGIWATHFIAMLAFTPGVPVAYDPPLTFLSLLVAIVVPSIGLAVATGHGRFSAGCGGAIIGSGIAAMHYLGMSAVHVQGQITWSLDLIAASVGAGMLLGVAAMNV